MKWTNRFFVALTALLFAAPALGQSVLQTGQVTPGHATSWATNGVIQDAGPATFSNLTSIGTTAVGPSICASNAKSGAINRLCLGTTATGGGTISLDNISGGTGGFTFKFNGATQGFPTVNLPVTTGDFSCFANTSGMLVDCGSNPNSGGGLGINVLNPIYGANTGTGSDDGPAIRAAVAAAVATGGNKIYFPQPPSGHYNTCSFGTDGHGAIWLPNSPGLASLTLIGTGPGGADVRILPSCVSSPNSVFYISGLEFGLQPASATRISFQNMRVDGYCKADPLNINYGTYFTSTNSVYRNAATGGQNILISAGYGNSIDDTNLLENVNDAGHTCYTSAASMPNYNLLNYSTDGYFAPYASNAYIASIFNPAGGANTYGGHVTGLYGGITYPTPYSYLIYGSAMIKAGAVADTFSVDGFYIRSLTQISPIGTAPGADQSGGYAVNVRCENAGPAPSGSCLHVDNTPGASYTGTASGTDHLTVTGVTGTLGASQIIATGPGAGNTIVSQFSGATGGAGVYVMSSTATGGPTAGTTTSPVGNWLITQNITQGIGSPPIKVDGTLPASTSIGNNSTLTPWNALYVGGAEFGAQQLNLTADANGTYITCVPLSSDCIIRSIAQGSGGQHQRYVNGNLIISETATAINPQVPVVMLPSTGVYFNNTSGGGFAQIENASNVLTFTAGNSGYVWDDPTGLIGWASLTGSAFTYKVPIVISGSSSGSATIQTQAAAGTPTITLGTNSGTPAVTASSPLSITTATGNITCSTCLTANQTITLSGDVAGSGTTAITTTLASVITAGGPTGSATVAPIITYDAKGRLTTVTSATITPAIGSITGLGTGVATALGINVGSAGAFVTFNGAGGTPSSMTATNLTGTASGLTAGNVTTNANLTGVITSSGNATAIASQTGTGTKFVVDTSPTLVTPILGVATATSVTAGGINLGTNTNGPSAYFAGNTFTSVGGTSGFQWNAQNQSSASMTLSNTGNLATTGTITAGTVNSATGLFVCETAGLLSSGVTTCVASDRAVKHDIVPIADVNLLDRVLAQRGMRFTYDEGKGASGRRIGVIANDWEKNFPELVDFDSQGVRHFDYAATWGLTVEMVRQLKADNDNLRACIDKVADLMRYPTQNRLSSPHFLGCHLASMDTNSSWPIHGFNECGALLPLPCKRVSNSGFQVRHSRRVHCVLRTAVVGVKDSGCHRQRSRNSQGVGRGL